MVLNNNPGDLCVEEKGKIRPANAKRNWILVVV